MKKPILINLSDEEKRNLVLYRPEEYDIDDRYVLGQTPEILGQNNALVKNNKNKANNVALKLEYSMGKLVLKDDIVTHQAIKLTKFKNTNGWSVILEAMLKATNNAPTKYKTISEELLIKNFVKKDSSVELTDLKSRISKFNKLWVYLQTNVIENNVLNLFRMKTHVGLKSKFRSAVTFEEIYNMPKEDYSNLVKILKKLSGNTYPPLQT